MALILVALVESLRAGEVVVGIVAVDSFVFRQQPVISLVDAEERPAVEVARG